MTYSDDVLKLNPELAKLAESKPASKYHNVRTEAKGLRFQSGHEAAEMGKLIIAEKRIRDGAYSRMGNPLWQTTSEGLDYPSPEWYAWGQQG